MLRGLARSLSFSFASPAARARGAKPQRSGSRSCASRIWARTTSADWIGRAIPVMLDAELADAPNIAMIGTSQFTPWMPLWARGLSRRREFPPSVSRPCWRARIAWRTAIIRCAAGRLHARLWLEDPRTQKIVKVAEVSTAAQTIASAPRPALARQLATRTRAILHSQRSGHPRLRRRIGSEGH